MKSPSRPAVAESPGARCAVHPDQLAVDTCARCGAFVCGDCADVGTDDQPSCVACRARSVAPRPVAGWALGAGLLSLLWLLLPVPMVYPFLLLLALVLCGVAVARGQRLAWLAVMVTLSPVLLMLASYVRWRLR